MASLLPLPDDPWFQEFIVAWPSIELGAQQLTAADGLQRFPRSGWLSTFERRLEPFYPQSSSRDRKLTARHYAPFYLRDGHDVP